MSADSEEGKCHKVYKQCVRFTSKGALENAMTQEKNMKNSDSDVLNATACSRPVNCMLEKYGNLQTKSPPYKTVLGKS